jgi:hypothetical protein
MYGLVFYYYYRFFVWKNDDSPIFGAKCGLAITIGFQIFFLYAVIQKFHGSRLINPGDGFFWSKWFYMILMIPFVYLITYLFNKTRVKAALDKYENSSNAFSLLNWVKFILLAIAPLVLIIVILKK